MQITLTNHLTDLLYQPDNPHYSDEDMTHFKADRP